MATTLQAKRAWRWAAFGALGVGVFWGGAATALLGDDGTLADGLHIEGINVAGLTPAQAESKLRETLGPEDPDAVTLVMGRSVWDMSDAKFDREPRYEAVVKEAYDLSRRGDALEQARTRLALTHEPKNLRLEVAADEAKLTKLIESLRPQIDREPKNARVKDRVGSRLYFQNEKSGRRLDTRATVAAIMANGHFPPTGQVDVVTQEVPAPVTVAELQKKINTRLASHTTSMTAHYYGVIRFNRMQNVRLCLERMNGHILAPGEEFSFNGVIGERKRSDGFLSSHIFIRKPDGTVEERMDTGGGICQLATTLFNTALYANMEITDRRNHSKMVSYARYGRDATIHYDAGVDFKFRNTLDEPVMVWGEVQGNGNLVVEIWGDASQNYDVDLHGGGALYRTVKTPGGTVVTDREYICSSYYPG